MMYRKFNAFFLSFAIMLAMVLGIGGHPARAAAAPASPAIAGGQLLSALPASDFVAYVDTQRLLNDTIPAFLGTKPDILFKLNAGIDKMKVETGIDLRSFDMIAVGMRYGSGPAKDVKMVVLVRGRFDASAIINAGFAAAAKDKNAFQRQSQEEYKGKTLYVVGPSASRTTTTTTTVVTNESKNQDAKATPGDAPVVMDDSAQPKPTTSQRTVVTALDSNTIAGGDIESVRATIDAQAGGAHVDDELVQLATRNASALVGYGGKQPAYLIGNPGHKDTSQDPYAKSLEGIQMFFGSFSTSGTDAEASLSLRMETPEQARGFKEMVNIFKPADGTNAKPASPDMLPGFSGLLRTLTVNVEGNEVQMQLKVTQADMAPFLPRL